MTIKLILLFASLCGLAAAFKGSRQAVFLLASLALTSVFTLVGVDFNVLLWLLIDAIVIALIYSKPLTFRDATIFVLFIPSWVAYAVGGQLAADLSSLAVSAQLIVTLPLGRIYARMRRALIHIDRMDTHDLELAGGTGG